jgi:glycerol-3-phosphate dehydrogenase
MSGLEQRKSAWNQLSNEGKWDVLVIGGGATGLGIALHAAASGLKTALVERNDFAQGTSSRSTKLIHGGVRYLQQGNVKLVKEALHERGLLMQNAPHLVHNMEFVIPTYKRWKRWYYGTGLKIYDRLAGRLGLGASRILSPHQAIAALPGVRSEGLTGGVSYHDGQFDDAHLALSLAATAVARGATLINHAEVTGILKRNQLAIGASVLNKLTGETQQVRAAFVVNATGAFSDAVMQMDRSNHAPMIRPSQGVHLVVDRTHFPGPSAMLIPKTDDGRVLFAVPWHGRVILGTTDTGLKQVSEEPQAMESEIDFILSHISRYLNQPLSRKDILSVFAGIRPLVKLTDKKTSELARDHVIRVSKSGMISILGGKWTTYRKMAADVLRKIHQRQDRDFALADTRMLRLVDFQAPARAANIEGLSDHELMELVKKEAAESMCMTVDDFLSRRTRQLLLDARHAIRRAPAVAEALAAELGYDEVWQNEQVAAFKKLASQYLPPQSDI